MKRTEDMTPAELAKQAIRNAIAERNRVDAATKAILPKDVPAIRQRNDGTGLKRRPR